MGNFYTKIKVLKVVTDVGFRGLFFSDESQRNVLPMFYPKSENLRKLFTLKGFHFLIVGPPGIEPGTY